ncbi:hypothetical protein GCM10009836_73030 [Pseudonocardia ailaonensis]|uniref:Transposase n=1 Tax=Pseudonocardia ailaonensis TaxID=367279 RepID=A0ABN2NPN5_9PSEU
MDEYGSGRSGRRSARHTTLHDVDPSAAQAPVRIPAQRSAPQDGPAAARDDHPQDQSRRRCGHGKSSHEHFRSGHECASCSCVRYNDAASLANVLINVLQRHR